jgi:hypothetical protein
MASDTENELSARGKFTRASGRDIGTLNRRWRGRTKVSHPWKMSAIALFLLCSCGSSRVPSAVQTGDFTTAFGGPLANPEHRDPNINYDLDPNQERYLVHVPADYTGTALYGLVVFIDSDDIVTRVPDGWGSVLDSRHLLFVAPEKAGNDNYEKRRMGLAVLGALEMMKRYRIDPNRVYAAGYSGGSRVAGTLGFFQSDVFHGTIQNCRADFYRRVPTVYASSWISTTGQPYGTFSASTEEIAQAKRVRFVLITGTNDFRRGNILDIFNGGFTQDGFQAKLLDVPGMGHSTCSGEILSAALSFIEGS